MLPHYDKAWSVLLGWRIRKGVTVDVYSGIFVTRYWWHTVHAGEVQKYVYGKRKTVKKKTDLVAVWCIAIVRLHSYCQRFSKFAISYFISVNIFTQSEWSKDNIYFKLPPLTIISILSLPGHTISNLKDLFLNV